MRWLGKEIFRFFQGQRGIGLIETVIALGILGFIGVVFLSAMTTGFRSTGIQDEQITAESLARTQLEIIKASDYLVNYDHLKISEPPQYSITIESPYVLWVDVDEEWVEYETDTSLQKITVRVSREGGKGLLILEALKRK